jgi:hypothetical protein
MLVNLPRLLHLNLLLHVVMLVNLPRLLHLNLLLHVVMLLNLPRLLHLNLLLHVVMLVNLPRLLHLNLLLKLSRLVFQWILYCTRICIEFGVIRKLFLQHFIPFLNGFELFVYGLGGVGCCC